MIIFFSLCFDFGICTAATAAVAATAAGQKMRLIFY